MDKYTYCENIIKASSATFYKAFSALDEKKAKAVFAVYAFCRTVDDAIDVHDDIEKLNVLETGIKRVFEGDIPDDLMFQAIAETLTWFPNTIDPYLALIDGMRDDFNKKPIETEQDLDDYCYKAASTVGLMLIPILASEAYKADSKKLRDVAIELGKAMQITNILRDVKEDLIHQRVYFPHTVLETQKVNIETLRTGIVTPEYKSMIEQYIMLAEEKYAYFYDHVHLFDEDARVQTVMASTFYEGILQEIRKASYNNLTKRHYVSKFRKWRLYKKALKEMKMKGYLT